MVERLLCKQEVRGSIPRVSTQKTARSEAQSSELAVSNWGDAAADESPPSPPLESRPHPVAGGSKLDRGTRGSLVTRQRQMAGARSGTPVSDFLRTLPKSPDSKNVRPAPCAEEEPDLQKRAKGDQRLRSFAGPVGTELVRPRIGPGRWRLCARRWVRACSTVGFRRSACTMSLATGIPDFSGPKSLLARNRRE